MSGAILQTAADLIAAGIPPDALFDALPEEIAKRDGEWADAFLAGEEPPDLDRLATLVAAGVVGLDEADHVLGRDVESALWEAQQRLDHPEPGDDPREIRRLLARLRAVQAKREKAWNAAAAAADYELDAATTYAAAAPAEALEHPNAAAAVAGIIRCSVLAEDAIQKLGKTSLGVLGGVGAAVCLPGPKDAPLVLTKDPQTAVALWRATGLETWCASGALADVEPEQGRPVIVARDDDPQSSPADKALRRAIAKWRRAGITVSVATPHAVRLFDKSSFADLLNEAGTDAVRERIEAARNVSSPTKRVPIEEARRLMDGVAARFSDVIRRHSDGDALPVLAAKIGVAVGKSSTTRRGIMIQIEGFRKAQDARNFCVLVPSHKLGNEAAEDFNREAAAEGFRARAAIWRGRQAEDPGAQGQTMCRDMARVYDAMAAGTDIEKACCRRVMDDGTVIECPFYRECGYQAQKAQRPDVWFGAHELAYNEKPSVLGDLAGLVIDESFWQSGLAGIEDRVALAIEALRNAPVPNGIDGQRLQFLRRLLWEVLDAHAVGPLSRAAFNTSLLTAEMATEANALEWRMKRDAGMHPGMSRAEYETAKAAAEGNKLIRRLSSIWKAVAALLGDDGPAASGWLAVQQESTQAGPIRVLRIKGRKPIRKGWNVPTLLLNATLEHELDRQYFPTVQIVANIEAEAPHQHVFQTTDRSYARRYFFENPNDTRHLRDLAASLGGMGRKYAPGRVLVVAQKAVREWLEANGNLPANVEMAHYNAIAGLDQWGPGQDRPGVAAVVCVGRVAAPPAAVEDMGEALTGAAVERLDGWYQKRETVREMSDGSSVTAEADFHPVPVCEAIRREICEGQLIQAVGRARAVNRTAANPVDVWLLNDAPTSLPVEGLMPAADLDPTPDDLMLMAGGLALENSSHVAAVFSGLWKTASTYRSAARRAAERSVAFPYKYIRRGPATLLPADFVRVEYQLAGGSNKPWKAIFDTSRIADPEAWLTDRVGALAVFRMVETAPQPVEGDQAIETAAEAVQPLPAANLMPPVRVVPDASPEPEELADIWEDGFLAVPTWMPPAWMTPTAHKTSLARKPT